MERTGWKYIEGFENYLVNKEGQVYSELTNKVLKTGDNGAGYKFVCLRSKGKTINKYVHRLVSQALLTGEGEEVNHIDGDKSNNKLSNLERVTSSQNTVHGFLSGLMFTQPIQIIKGGVGAVVPYTEAMCRSVGSQ